LSFTLTLSIVQSEQLYYGYGEYDLHQYEECFVILDNYIAFVIWTNDDPSPMSTAGDGLPHLCMMSVYVILRLSDRINSTSLVLCSCLAGACWTNN
jgi:hypothetical protein